MNDLIELYYWPTPNGWKVTIMLEETGIPYTVIPVDITAGDQFKPDFLSISPNNKIPVIVDPNGPDAKPISLFDSAVILQYLADKTGRFFPTNTRNRYLVKQWLAFQMGHIGPMLGQAHHFRKYAPTPIPYAIDRYTDEATRLYRVLDKRLSESEYLAGEYSIADIATFPWIIPYKRQGQDLEDFPNIRRWFDAIKLRPAVQRGVDVMKDQRMSTNLDQKTRDNLFGTRQKSQI